MTIVKALFLYQLLIISSNADAQSATKYIKAFEAVGDTFKTYSEFSVLKKVSVVKNGLKTLSGALSAITGPVGAISAIIDIGLGNVE